MLVVVVFSAIGAVVLCIAGTMVNLVLGENTWGEAVCAVIIGFAFLAVGLATLLFV